MREPFAGPLAPLGAYRGIPPLGGLVLVSEVCNYGRCATASAFMSWCGLIPSEYSSGGTTRRGHLSKAGSEMVGNQLVESAWAYQHRASVGVGLRARQQQVSSATIARSWAAQQWLCGKLRKLSARKDSKSVVNAIASPRARRVCRPEPSRPGTRAPSLGHPPADHDLRWPTRVHRKRRSHRHVRNRPRRGLPPTPGNTRTP